MRIFRLGLGAVPILLAPIGVMSYFAGSSPSCPNTVTFLQRWENFCNLITLNSGSTFTYDDFVYSVSPSGQSDTPSDDTTFVCGFSDGSCQYTYQPSTQVWTERAGDMCTPTQVTAEAARTSLRPGQSKVGARYNYNCPSIAKNNQGTLDVPLDQVQFSRNRYDYLGNPLLICRYSAPGRYASCSYAADGHTTQYSTNGCYEEACPAPNPADGDVYGRRRHNQHPAHMRRQVDTQKLREKLRKARNAKDAPRAADAQLE